MPQVIVPALVFQPTLSVWRETEEMMALTRGEIFQPTLSVWRETEVPGALVGSFLFQPTLSVWRETLTAIHSS